MFNKSKKENTPKFEGKIIVNGKETDLRDGSLE